MNTDTLKKDSLNTADTPRYFTKGKVPLFVPAAFIAVGASSFVLNPVKNFDNFIRGEVKKNDPHFNTNAESYFMFAPVALVYGLNFAGIKGKNNFADRTALLTLSAGILGLTGYTTRFITHNSDIHKPRHPAFPSMHTSTAFMGATFLAEEYGDQSPVYTVLGYSIAVTTGIFRIYNRDHVFSEVIAGAGFGILSTELAYRVYPYIRTKLSHTNKYGRSTMILPTYQDGVPGLSLAIQL